jgi:hypothetical protein
MDKTEMIERMNKTLDDILAEKIIKKNDQYGSSIDSPLNVFNDLMNPQLLINIRIDDKLSRLRMLVEDDPKYWSEVKEIIAYLLWKIVLHEKRYPHHPNPTINDAEQAKLNVSCHGCKYYIENKEDRYGFCNFHNYYTYEYDYCEDQTKRED